MTQRGRQTNHTTSTYSDSLAELEQRIYESDSEHRGSQERAHLSAIKRRVDRDQEAKRLARAEERDQQNHEQMKQIKAEEKQRCINAGMTASDFASYWSSKRKFEIITDRMNARAKAQGMDGMYNNSL